MNNDLETQLALPVARISHHRPAAIQLPDDPRLATASVLAYLCGNDQLDRAAALEALTLRAATLSAIDPQQAIEALAEQLPVLNALFLLFSAESAATKNPDARAKFVKLALAAQNSYARTQALVIGLRAQSEGKAQVTLNDADEVVS